MVDPLILAAPLSVIPSTSDHSSIPDRQVFFISSTDNGQLRPPASVDRIHVCFQTLCFHFCTNFFLLFFISQVSDQCRPPPPSTSRRRRRWRGTATSSTKSPSSTSPMLTWHQPRQYLLRQPAVTKPSSSVTQRQQTAPSTPSPLRPSLSSLRQMTDVKHPSPAVKDHPTPLVTSPSSTIKRCRYLRPRDVWMMKAHSSGCRVIPYVDGRAEDLEAHGQTRGQEGSWHSSGS